MAMQHRGKRGETRWLTSQDNTFAHILPILEAHGVRLRKSIQRLKNAGLLDPGTQGSFRANSRGADVKHTFNEIKGRLVFGGVQASIAESIDFIPTLRAELERLCEQERAAARSAAGEGDQN